MRLSDSDAGEKNGATGRAKGTILFDKIEYGPVRGLTHQRELGRGNSLREPRHANTGSRLEMSEMYVRNEAGKVNSCQDSPRRWWRSGVGNRSQICVLPNSETLATEEQHNSHASQPRTT